MKTLLLLLSTSLIFLIIGANFFPIVRIENKVVYINRNELTKENVYYYFRLFDMKQGDIVMAQAMLETSFLKSNVCLTHQNLFGLCRNDKPIHFAHWIESVLLYKLLINNRYHSGSYYKFLEGIGYAKDLNYCKKMKGIR